MSPEPLDIRSLTGLTAAEAARRFETDGPNEIASEKPRNVFQIAWAVVREPMLLLLVAAGSLNLVISAMRPHENRVCEALLLFMFVVVVIGITFY